MDIKFIRGVAHLGYAYRAGQGAGSLPDEKAKWFIEHGYAIEVKDKPRPKRVRPKVQDTAVKKARDTTVVRRKK